MKPRLKAKYESELKSSLIEEFGYKNAMEVPRVEKVVINMGVGEAIQDSKKLKTAVNELTLISGQRPVVTKAKNSIAGFKLREEMSIGCKVTLRNDRAGHGIPGGITKTLIIRLYTRDSVGNQLFENHVEIRQANQLLPGASWSERIAVTPATEVIGLTLQYRYADHQQASEYLHIETFERVIR